MAAEYNIGDLLMQAFGVPRPVTFPDAIAQENGSAPAIDYPGVDVVSREEAEELSALGTPIIFPITLVGGVYHIYNRMGDVAKTQVKDFRLPLSCLASFSRQKIKNSTRVVASKASVKEMYGHEDWQIRIRGICLADEGHPQGAKTAMQQHNRLLEFEALADSIEIEGALFREKGIYRIDIDQISIDQLQGKPGVIPFNITATSDDPLELIVKS